MQIITEEQAKEKWCPFARTGIYTGNGAVSVNRHCTDGLPEIKYREIYSETRCIGTACMAWNVFLTNDGDTEEGFCGLANK